MVGIDAKRQHAHTVRHNRGDENMRPGIFFDLLILGIDTIILLDLIRKISGGEQPQESQKKLIATHVTPAVVLTAILIVLG
ncbi:MAG: hypothetical protein GXO14_03545 [Thermococci archaeon]|nr:hypothetical protein [Thermococci archaeon]